VTSAGDAVGVEGAPGGPDLVYRAVLPMMSLSGFLETTQHCRQLCSMYHSCPWTLHRGAACPAIQVSCPVSSSQLSCQQGSTVSLQTASLVTWQCMSGLRGFPAVVTAWPLCCCLSPCPRPPPQGAHPQGGRHHCHRAVWCEGPSAPTARHGWPSSSGGRAIRGRGIRLDQGTLQPTRGDRGGAGGRRDWQLTADCQLPVVTICRAASRSYLPPFVLPH
jgi:hypothetical protein